MSLFGKTPDEKFFESLERQKRILKVKEGLSNALNYVNNNKEKIAGAAALAYGLFRCANKTVNAIDRHNQHKVELQRRKQFYDRSTNTYVDLKKSLNKSDWDKVNELKSQGMKTAEALRKLNLIK